MSIRPRESTIARGDAATTAAPTYRRQRRAFDFYNLATNALFTNAISLIYLAAHGYSPFAIGLFELVYQIAKLLAEVPTGVFADLAGRRRSLIIACLLSAAVALYLVPVVPLLVLSSALAGAAQAFRGGANEALLWGVAGNPGSNGSSDGTSGNGERVKRYSRLVSRMYVLGSVAETAGVASGGYLGHLLLTLPFICQAGATLLGIVPLLALPEQRTASHAGGTNPHPLAHFGAGLGAVRRDPALLGLLLVGALTASTWQTVFFYNQLYFRGLGYALPTVGLILAAALGTGTLATAFAPRVMGALPERTLVPALVAGEALGLLAMTTQQPVLGLLGFLVVFQSAASLLQPALSTYQNARCPEAQRATVLSLQTGLFSAGSIVLFPLFGLGLTHFTFAQVYGWTLAALVAGSLAIFALTRALRGAQGGGTVEGAERHNA